MRERGGLDGIGAAGWPLLSTASPRGLALRFCLAYVALPACAWRMLYGVRLAVGRTCGGKKNVLRSPMDY